MILSDEVNRDALLPGRARHLVLARALDITGADHIVQVLRQNSRTGPQDMKLGGPETDLGRHSVEQRGFPVLEAGGDFGEQDVLSPEVGEALGNRRGGNHLAIAWQPVSADRFH